MDKAPPPPPAKFPDQPLYVVVQDFLRSKTRKEQIAIAAGAAVVTVGTIYLFVQYRNSKGATAPRTGTTASKHSTPKTPKKT
ncbi:hypothetical protein Q1695_008739 [Nippostrongylus brasiliensis]|nr:hypothetical protein Q1695_008739 [Nippostrongylus brasiliensis]